MVVIEPGEELGFLHPLPIEALWGVGPATSRRLRALGLSTVGDLAAVPAEVLETAVGRASGAHLAALARGVDERSVEPDREVKSISHEETYAEDRFDHDLMRVEVVRMSDAVAQRVRDAGLSGRTVTLKIRYGDFTTQTRSRTVAGGVADGPIIAGVAAGLFAELDLSKGVRLLGVGVSNLATAGSGGGRQLSLGLDAAPTEAATGAKSPPSERISSASGAVDAIRARFGARAVGPAALVASDGLRVKVRGDTQWGPSDPAGPDPVSSHPEDRVRPGLPSARAEVSARSPERRRGPAGADPFALP